MSQSKFIPPPHRSLLSAVLWDVSIVTMCTEVGRLLYISANGSLTPPTYRRGFGSNRTQEVVCLPINMLAYSTYLLQSAGQAQALGISEQMESLKHERPYNHADEMCLVSFQTWMSCPYKQYYTRSNITLSANKHRWCCRSSLPFVSDR